MSTPVGSRIGAILKATQTTVHLIGFGEYVGNEVPTAEAAGIGKIMHENSITSPKLVMDDGQIAWGCECWWGPEDQIRAKIEGLEVIPVNMTEARKGE